MKSESLPVSLSIGLVTFTKVPESIDAMIAKADKLMYQVKLNGKSNIEYEIF